MRHLPLLLASAATIVSVGCGGQSPGTTRTLGEVDYTTAFATAREVLAENGFVVESANPDTGVIRTRPRPADAAGERLLGESQARQLATLRLRKENGQVAADLAVAQQRQDSEVFRQMSGPSQSYTGVPSNTPAEMEGPSDPQQRRAWRTDTYRGDIERMILEELYLSLHGENR
ncbi:MAG: hypothetical protein ACLFVW_01915 [Phycisphaerae bacterium]